MRHIFKFISELMVYIPRWRVFCNQVTVVHDIWYIGVDRWFNQNCYCIHTYMHTYMHAYMHTYMHTYIHTYMHTYKHTNARHMHECTTYTRTHDICSNTRDTHKCTAYTQTHNIYTYECATYSHAHVRIHTKHIHIIAHTHERTT